MGGTRIGMDWAGTVIPLVLTAIDEYNQQRPFVNSKAIARHIRNNLDRYSFFAGISERATSQRVHMSMQKMDWRIFSKHTCRRGGCVFIDPRYRE